MNRLLEIKLSLLIISLVGMAIIASILTALYINGTRTPCPPCLLPLSSSSSIKPIQPPKRTEHLEIVPENNGRKF